MHQDRRFGGIARLYGPAVLDYFSRAQVVIIGVGGVGSWVVEAMARSGIGALTLIDLDHIAESNINRQIQALEPDLGKAKVQALAERVRLINPKAQVQTLEAFVEPPTIASLLATPADFYFDCIDGSRNKAALLAFLKAESRPFIALGAAGGLLDPTRIRIADLSQTVQDPLLAKTRKLLRDHFGFPAQPARRMGVPCVFSDEPKTSRADIPDTQCENLTRKTPGLNCGGFGSVVTVTASFGMVAASYGLNMLAARVTAH